MPGTLANAAGARIIPILQKGNRFREVSDMPKETQLVAGGVGI